MSSGSPTVTDMAKVDEPADDPMSIPAHVMPSVAGGESYMWDQIHSVVRASVSRSDIETRHIGAQTYRDVARGVRVSDEEYQTRFAGIDLEGFRSRMSPQTFQAFVRFMGILPGDSRVNVVDIATIPE